MVIEMPFDLVQDVTCFLRVFASSKAYFMIRSTPLRLNTDNCVTTSFGVPSNMRPPTLPYSPSCFPG